MCSFSLSTFLRHDPSIFLLYFPGLACEFSRFSCLCFLSPCKSVGNIGICGLWYCTLLAHRFWGFKFRSLYWNRNLSNALSHLSSPHFHFFSVIPHSLAVFLLYLLKCFIYSPYQSIALLLSIYFLIVILLWYCLVISLSLLCYCLFISLSLYCCYCLFISLSSILLCYCVLLLLCIQLLTPYLEFDL